MTDQVTAPVLLAASPHAVFLLADSLARAERYYATLPGLSHNEFISQGLLASDFEARVDPEAPEEYLGDPDVMATYGSVVTIVRRFLDGYLKRDAAALDTLRSGLASAPLGGPSPHVEYVPRGATSAPPYSDTSSRPPTPRQLRPLIARVGVEETIRILGRWTDAASGSPVLDEATFATALLWEYVLAGRIGEARRLYAFFDEVHENMIGEFLRWHDIFSAMEDDVTADEWLGIAEALDPTHPEVRARSGSP